MLASDPASMVNQKRADLGIPNRFKLTPSRFKGVERAAPTRAIASARRQLVEIGIFRWGGINPASRGSFAVQTDAGGQSGCRHC